MLPLQPIDLAIAEIRYARRDLGMRGGFLRPNPYNNRMLHDPVYEPLWSAAEDLDFVIGIHEGGNIGMPTVGIDRFEGRGAQHIISHTMEMMLACMSMIWGGACERHPKLRVGFLESGGGWIAPWLDRMDRHFDDQGFNDSGLSRRGRANCSGAIAGSRSNLSRAASKSSPSILARTRFCGRPTFRTATASFPALRQ
jgi:predicted TIM-barrel fold metal-dependent hydrolase